MDVSRKISYLEKDWPVIGELFRVIDEECFITREDLCSRAKDNFIVNARIIFCYLIATEVPNILRRDIGEIVHRDHATITYYISQYEGRYKFDKRFQKQANTIINRLEQIKEKENGME